MRIDKALKEAARRYAEDHFMNVTDVFTQALVEYLRTRNALDLPVRRPGDRARGESR